MNSIVLIIFLFLLASCSHHSLKKQASSDLLADYKLTSPSEKLWLKLEGTLGLKYCVDGKVNKGLSIIKREMLADPSKSLLVNELGLCHALEKNWHRALYFLNLSLKKDNHFQIHNNLAVIYVELNNYQKAYEHLSQAMKLAKDSPLVRLNYAWLLYNLSNYQDSLKHFNQLQSAFNYESVQIGIALCHYQLNDNQKALLNFKNVANYENYKWALPKAFIVAMKLNDQDFAAKLWPLLSKVENNEAKVLVAKYATSFNGQAD